MDEQILRQMAQFEAARLSAPVALEPAPVQAILAVLDGSDQDQTVRALAQAMAARAKATVEELKASEREPLDAILSAQRGKQIVVAPCPFGRDYEADGTQSLSTTIDLLLCRSDAAVCLARAPVADPDRCVSHPLVALHVDRHRKVEATAMALTLAKGGGELALLSVVDPQQPVQSQELLGRFLDPHDLSPEVLTGLASARAAALTAALQRRSREWDVRPRVKFALGDEVAIALQLDESRHGLLVAGRDRDARSEAAQRAHRLALASRWPVLLV